MFQYNNKSIFFSIPEIIKVLTLILLVIVVFVFDNIIYLVILFFVVFSLLLISKYKLKDFVRLLIALSPFLILTNIFFFLFFSDVIDNIFLFLGTVSLRAVTLFMSFAFFTSTTDLFAFLKLMKKIRVPRVIYLSFYIILRFLPELEREYTEIKNIQKIRGITLKKGFFRFIKAYSLPIIFVLLERAEEISIALYLKEKI